MYLVFNVGSSSLKLAVFEPRANAPLTRVASFEASGLGTPTLSSRASWKGKREDLTVAFADLTTHAAVLAKALIWLEGHEFARTSVRAVGHRVVHGGSAFCKPVLIDEDVRAQLSALATLAPLHTPPCLAVIEAVTCEMPTAVQVACFDTAFHATMPREAQRLPLPIALHEQGYRRYGFHGLSYECAVGDLEQRMGRLPDRLVVLHLGNGASATAILRGKSVATTMGYSAVDGLVMGTRTGTLDPGVLLSLMRDQGYTPAALEKLIYHESGLRALSGETSDMRTLLASSSKNAAFAVDYYAYWAARHVGSLVVATGGLDALVFTGGIGENAAPVRAKICLHLAWLGVALDPQRNQANAADISAASATVSTLIVRADEEGVIAAHVHRSISAA